jgi:hypothetical protein
MTELEKIFITSFLTIFGGVVVFVLGQIITKFFVEPIHDQFRLIGEIADSLIFYANLYMNPGSGKPEKMDEAAQKLRQQSSQLRARTYAIRWYELWEFVGLVLKRTDVMEASHNLMGLSQFVHQGDALKNEERRREIEKRLGIKT